MPAGELRTLLRDAVKGFMPAGALAAAKVAEESEREGLRALAGVVAENGLHLVLEHLGRDP